MGQIIENLMVFEHSLKIKIRQSEQPD